MSKIPNLNFKKIRKKLNCTQKEFDEKLKLPAQKTSQIENNRAKMDDEILKKLREVFNVNPLFVLFEEGEIFLNKNNEEHRDANKKIINGDNAMINVNSGHKVKSYINSNINKQNLKNSDDNEINELIDIYTHLPPVEQKKAFYRLKLQALEVQS